MFRIECFVDDKKLGNALRALVGLVIDDPKVQPVVNAVKKNGKLVADGSGDLLDLFDKHIKETKLTQVDANEMRKFCKRAGYAESSASYFSQRLVKAGMLKKIGKGSHIHYEVQS